MNYVEGQAPHNVNGGRQKLVTWMCHELPRESVAHIEAVVDHLINHEWLSADYYGHAKNRYVLQPIGEKEVPDAS